MSCPIEVMLVALLIWLAARTQSWWLLVVVLGLFAAMAMLRRALR